MIGEPRIADAILDRIIHNAHHVTLEGDSMRKQKALPLLTGAENGQINRKCLQPGTRRPTTSSCPRLNETAVRDLAERLSRFCEVRTPAAFPGPEAGSKGEPVVEPDCMGSDLRRERMALVADGRGVNAIGSMPQIPERDLS